MRVKTRRKFFGKIAAMAAFVTGAKLFAQEAPAAGAASPASTSNPDKDAAHRCFSTKAREPGTSGTCQ
jgi:hypothetical protein